MVALAAKGFDLGRNRLELILAASGKYNVAARTRQFERDAAPNALV